MKEPNEYNNLISQAVSGILLWYPSVRRPLPWRQELSPYHTWVAEIMLQQTRIEAVIPYYYRFLKELPDIPALAAVPDDRLLKLWEGLGYYSRARNLKKAAILLTEQYGGSLPASVAELRKLPGIGEYTAGAIASIAFGLPEPAVDGNVLRVMMRFLACPDDIADIRTKHAVQDLLRAKYPVGEGAALLTEGLMELGETVCLPNGAPRCEQCPLKSFCTAHRTSRELAFPTKSAKKLRRREKKTVLLLCCGNRFAIRRRPGTGLLAGLWEFPTLDGSLSEEEVLLYAEALKLPVLEALPCGTSRHIFTHVEWEMTGFSLLCGAEHPDFLWRSAEEITLEFPLPTAFRPWQKIIRGLSQGGGSTPS